MNNKYIISFAIGVIITLLLLRQCSKPEVIKETVTKWKIDTLTVDKIVNKPVYIERTKTIKGKDSIIYKDKPNDSTITANQYTTTLKSNEASADLKITTTGELLDLTGTITYPEKETTITETKQASGLYLFGSNPIKSVQPEIGVLYQVNNKVFIFASGQYNNYTNSIDAKAGIGIKIFN
jgi:hypothetical protein